MIGENRVTFELSDDGIPPKKRVVDFVFLVNPIRDEILVTKGVKGIQKVDIFHYKDLDRLGWLSYYELISEFLQRRVG